MKTENENSKKLSKEGSEKYLNSSKKELFEIIEAEECLKITILNRFDKIVEKIRKIDLSSKPYECEILRKKVLDIIEELR